MGSEPSKMSKSPQCVWAQRDDLVYFTIKQVDIKDENVDVDFDGGKIQFAGGDYALDLELFEALKPDGSKWNNTGREIQFLLMKKEDKWWDRLTKAPSKDYRFIKTDFDKWKDEDEQDEDTSGPGNIGAGGQDFSSMMGGMGGMDMAKMMEQMGGMGGMGGDDAELDSDDED